MSIQGPTILIAAQPAPDLVDALRAAGAFPVVETNWADAPTAFNSIKPCAVVIADAVAPTDTATRMLCLQIATANGPIVPVIARVDAQAAAPIPIALCIDAALPVERLTARLRSALRVRSLHATVLRRIENFASSGKGIVRLPASDALEDATVLVVGRGKLYSELSAAIGERVGMLGALSLESAAQHMNARDIDGIVVGDGFSQRMIDGFLSSLTHDTRFRDIPMMIASDVAPDLAAALPNVDRFSQNSARMGERFLPFVRMRALEARFKRVLKTLDAEGMFDPDTALLTRDKFGHDFGAAVGEAINGGGALSLARFAFDGKPDGRISVDAARIISRLTRNIDFGCLEEDGSIFMALTQTDLKSAHVIVRRIGAMLKQTQIAQGADSAPVITLATLKAGDNAGSLLMRVMGAQAVAAE